MHNTVHIYPRFQVCARWSVNEMQIIFKLPVTHIFGNKVLRFMKVELSEFYSRYQYVALATVPNKALKCNTSAHAVA